MFPPMSGASVKAESFTEVEHIKASRPRGRRSPACSKIRSFFYFGPISHCLIKSSFRCDAVQLDLNISFQRTPPSCQSATCPGPGIRGAARRWKSFARDRDFACGLSRILTVSLDHVCRHRLINPCETLTQEWLLKNQTVPIHFLRDQHGIGRGESIL